MMKKVLSLILGLFMMFSFALADQPSEAAAGAAADGTAVPEYMTPRQFMSMFNSSFAMSVDLMRGTLGEDEADRLVKKYSLSQYDADGLFCYYGAEDWLIEAGFAFYRPEEASPDGQAYLWFLSIKDEAEESAWYAAMYTLNLMIGYTYRDTLGADAVREWFQTVTPGSTLELPDGYILTAARQEDGISFIMTPNTK